MSENVKVDVNFFFGDKPKPVTHTGTGHSVRGTGYCVWQWKDNRWVMVKNRCAPACVPQEPMSNGRFKGQFRAVICIPQEYRSKPQSP